MPSHLVVYFAKIFPYIKIQMSKLKCQMNVKAQISKSMARSVFLTFDNLDLI